MSETSHEKDQQDVGGPQVTGGGGHEPDPDETGATETPQPSGGGGVDLKSSDVPET